jgi:hypothetical protein
MTLDTSARKSNAIFFRRRLSDVEQELTTLPEFTSGFSWVRVAQSPLIFCVLFCRSLFLSVFFWPLCCLSFFDLRRWRLQTFLQDKDDIHFICIPSCNIPS